MQPVELSVGGQTVHAIQASDCCGETSHNWVPDRNVFACKCGKQVEATFLLNGKEFSSLKEVEQELKSPPAAKSRKKVRGEIADPLAGKGLRELKESLKEVMNEFIENQKRSLLSAYHLGEVLTAIKKMTKKGEFGTICEQLCPMPERDRRRCMELYRLYVAQPARLAGISIDAAIEKAKKTGASPTPKKSSRPSEGEKKSDAPLSKVSDAKGFQDQFKDADPEVQTAIVRGFMKVSEGFELTLKDDADLIKDAVLTASQTEKQDLLSLLGSEADSTRDDVSDNDRVGYLVEAFDDLDAKHKLKALKRIIDGLSIEPTKKALRMVNAKIAGFDAREMELPESLNTEAFRELWCEWVSHRDEIKAPLTPTSTDQQIKQLAKIGVKKAMKQMAYTMYRGWKGLRDPSTTEPDAASQDGGRRVEPPEYEQPEETLAQRKAKLARQREEAVAAT